MKAAGAITRRQRWRERRSTAAGTSSVWVSAAFARGSSYRDATDGDCSARNRSVCQVQLSWQRDIGPEYETAASATHDYVKATSESTECVAAT